ncbi:glycosyltransferase [Ornithinimicrobium cerasi]|uniref:glycosyltransferase n=1 Tax=Ornithinimicrobium cerasi TaxID=2248773 RepID=UPI000F006E36|nr:glycosyltransferase [Ornithinimicrobium cerasi]
MRALAAELTVAYSSLAERVADIRPPAERRIEVLVCVQGPTAGLQVPEGVDRVVPVPGRGVARSRNAAIENSRRRYLLFCDDDVEIRTDGVLAAVDHLRRSGAALALGRAVDPEGRLRKRYRSDRPTRLTRTNSAKAATYEMLVDVAQVRQTGLRFDERFGAGVETYLGDEYLFIAELLRAGLRGYAVPYVFGVHPPTSSGSRWGGADLHARAVVLNHVFSPWAAPARVAFALRHRRSIGGREQLVRFATDRTTLDEALRRRGHARAVDPGEQRPPTQPPA